jgi:glycosyltransferase involved in cell wall biosynthesis
MQDITPLPGTCDQREQGAIGSRPLKVAQLHNYYKEGGGEDRVVDFEKALLEQNGHTVVPYYVHNDTIESFADKAATALRTAYNTQSRDKLTRWLAEVKPDVVHCHNYFPQFSPSIYGAAQASGAAVVQTMHNYRVMCAGAFLMRDNKVCEKCLTGSPMWGVVHRCYRNSFIGSLASVNMIRSYRRHAASIDRFIVLTKFELEKFASAGFERQRLALKPNFIADPGVPAPGERRGGLFVGRVTSEKGIDSLVEAWRRIREPLRIAGDGPLLDSLRASAPPHVTFLGRINSERVRAELDTAEFLLVPSTWYEGFPIVLLEAFAAGVPVIASRIGSLAEIIEPGQNGLHCQPSNVADIVRQAEWAFAHRDDMRRMGQIARAHYETRYSPAANYRKLRAIYDDAIAHHRSRTV